LSIPQIVRNHYLPQALASYRVNFGEAKLILLALLLISVIAVKIASFMV